MRPIFSLFILPSAIVFLDQLSKNIISRTMLLGQSLPILDNVLHLTYIRNKGAAFGIPVNDNLLVIISISVIAVILVYYFLKNIELSLWQNIALGFILGGALSNLIDRLRFKSVIDFIDFKIWPIFNVADSFISIGVGLLLLDLLRTSKFGFRIFKYFICVFNF